MALPVPGPASQYNRGDSPGGPAWATKKAIESRQYQVGKVGVTVYVHTRSRLVTFTYPMQFAECVMKELDHAHGNVGDVSLPILLKETRMAPSYPELARVARIEGTVILQALVQADGTVAELCVQKCNRPGMGFEEAAMEAVKKWRYEPAMLEGEPVEVYFTVRVDFKLE
jgi:TonB family protein